MKIPPLSPELEALLAPHRAVLPLAPSVEARALARAAAAGTVASPEPYVRHLFQPPRWAFAAAAGAVFALGAAAYAARGWIGVPWSRAADVAPIASEPRPRPVVSAAPETGAPETSAPSVAPRVKRVAGKTPVATTRPTNAELQLLRAAREDVARGDFARALAVIGEHARRFRNGSLVEEREALRVKSLAGVGRHQDAQRAAAQFHARFPHSVYLSTFERIRDADR